MICLGRWVFFGALIIFCLLIGLLSAILALLIIYRRHTKKEFRQLRHCRGPTGPPGPIGPTGATIDSPGMVLLNSNTFNIIDGTVIGSGYITTTANEFMAAFIVTSAFTLRNLFVNLSTIPGGGNARTFTVRVNGIDTPLALTISGFATSATNTGNFIPVVPGDRISLRTTSLGAPMPSTCEASFEFV